MELKKINCLGYRGTDVKGGESILRCNKLNYSIDEEEWLGKGIYFFENDKKQAIYYASKAKKFTQYKIIKVNIKSDKTLDLIDTSTVELFNEVAHRIKDKYKKRKDGRQRELLNSVILNVMYSLLPYEVVRAVFPVPKKNVIVRTNITPMQIQLCVRSHNCISEIEEVI